MRKRFTYFGFLLILLSSCEEYYRPVIDQTTVQLVVDAQITNDTTNSYVHLTKSRDFYSDLPVELVSGAKVELIEINGKVTLGKENGTGKFTFGYIPVTGKNYQLRITVDKDVYESEVVTMPPLPEISNYYSADKEQKTYKTDAIGLPYASISQGRELYFDLPVSNSISNYRFYVRSVLEWVYYNLKKSPPPPPVYGWESHYDNSSYNLAGTQKSNVSVSKIEQHPLLWLSYSSEYYLQTDTLISNGWIIIVDQYGTTSGSYNYHQQLNNQLAASGSLFDPIQTQINGNLTCKTNPSKIVFGYFDLNSYRQVRYFMFLSSPLAAIKLRQLYDFPFIPENGLANGFPPDWWQQ